MSTGYRRRTKIVATIGPASAPEKRLRELIRAGVNVCRLNFSHGTHESHKRILDRIRQIEAELSTPVAVLQDLCGPKIRVTRFPDGKLDLRVGQEVELVADLDVADRPGRIGASYSHLAEDTREGQRILLDDGLLELRVLRISPEDRTVRCLVVVGGVLKDNKGLNLPDSVLRVPSLTEKDREDFLWGLENQVDYVALSFVRHEDDVKTLRELSAGLELPPKIIAKIEKPQAVARLREIVDAFDGVMVARGDLSVEMPLHEVPAIQKRIIRMAILRDKPVITATQMLDSMQERPRPTRAEVSDVANAIYDGTDAVMLSGETASGSYPVESVRVMAQIAEATDHDVEQQRGSARHESNIDLETFCDSICAGALRVHEALGAKVLVCFTRTGRTALFMSKYMPTVPIIGVTTEARAVRRLCLMRGVEPIRVGHNERSEGLVAEAEEEIIRRGFGVRGDLAVYVGGANLTAKGNINSLKVRRLGEVGGL